MNRSRAVAWIGPQLATYGTRSMDLHRGHRPSQPKEDG
jgi:hypothetical protein